MQVSGLCYNGACPPETSELHCGGGAGASVMSELVSLSTGPINAFEN